MELKVKYQYSYFLYPYVIDEDKYERYIIKLLKDKNCELKIFEKEKDLDLYNYFHPNIRDNFFPTFELRGEILKEFNDLSVEKKGRKLSDYSCVCFDYKMAEDIQGKMGNENGIFFNIPKIEIICFKTGICFLSIKTHIEGSENFADLLNFNYKFKEINSEFSDLKKFENINIQTGIYKDSKKITDVINEIAGDSKKVDLVNNKFYTFSYACIPSDYWNDRNEFENLESEFLKYANTFPSSYIVGINKNNDDQNLSVISKMKYSRTGITNMNCNLLCSTADMYNYTKLPYEYETMIYYTYVLRLYQKLFLNYINSEFKSYEKIIRIRRKFIEFTNSLWSKDITNDDTGSLYYKMLNESLEIEELFEQIGKKYEIIYKDLNIEKNNRDNIIVVMLLIASLVLNTITILSYLYLR
ncbi:MAG: hypothetical protein IKF52_00325 [Clostridia bacterium]|nr:hypothetical protein [Clostridia bacterium]